VRAFGEMAVECAPVYYMYGAALFCKAQDESDVFGPPAADAPAAAPEPAEDDSEDAASDEDDDADADMAPKSDMQQAWEILDLARHIYSGCVAGASVGAPCAPEHCAALAECHVQLGQIHREQDQCESALAEFEKALALFRTLQLPSHRHVAGVLYDAALALQQLERPMEALARFGEAIAACQTRLTELRMAAPAGGDAADASADAEAREIGTIVEDMCAREEELRGSAADEARRQAFAGMAGAASGATAFDAPNMGTSAPAVDLGVVGRAVTRITPAAAGAQRRAQGASRPDDP
jgi:tetratricopeptide (TPR) repeat protein